MSNPTCQDNFKSFVDCLNSVLDDYFDEISEHIDKGYLTESDVAYISLIKNQNSRIKAKKKGKIFLGGF